MRLYTLEEYSEVRDLTGLPLQGKGLTVRSEIEVGDVVGLDLVARDRSWRSTTLFKVTAIEPQSDKLHGVVVSSVYANIPTVLKAGDEITFLRKQVAYIPLLLNTRFEASRNTSAKYSIPKANRLTTWGGVSILEEARKFVVVGDVVRIQIVFEPRGHWDAPYVKIVNVLQDDTLVGEVLNYYLRASEEHALLGSSWESEDEPPHKRIRGALMTFRRDAIFEMPTCWNKRLEQETLPYLQS
jgi:hypothetical protein